MQEVYVRLPSVSNINQRSNSKSGGGARSSNKRRGFVFQGGEDDDDEEEEGVNGDVAMGDDDHDESDAKIARKNSSRSANVFVFRAKKPSAKVVDVSTASAALLSKKERAQKAEERRQRAQKKKQDKEHEAAYVKQLERKLSPDQLDLYQIMSAQVARELRKTYREFENSSARKDIFHLSACEHERESVG